MKRRPSLARDVFAGAAAGVVGMVASGAADRVLDRLIAAGTKRGRRSGHAVAADAFARRLFGDDERSLRRGRVLFHGLYGVGWGIAYAALRRRVPSVARAAGLPFAVPFFLACDGAIAPLARLAPPLTRIPWPLDAKELADHVAWTAATSLVERAARRFLGRLA